MFNVITKSGGNEFRGDVFAYYSGADWSDSRVRRQDKGTQYNANLTDSTDVGLSLGGPIMRDRLWFFASYNPARRTTNIGSIVTADGHVDSTATEYDTDTDHYNGKLTWSATPNHNIVLSAFGDPTTRTGWLGIANADAGVALRKAEIGSNSYAVRYTGIISPRFLAEANIGRFERDNTLAPSTDTGRNIPRQIDENGTSNNFGHEYGGFQRSRTTGEAYAYALKPRTTSFDGSAIWNRVENNQYDGDLHGTWYRYFGDAGPGVCRSSSARLFRDRLRRDCESGVFLQDQWKVRSNRSSTRRPL